MRNPRRARLFLTVLLLLAFTLITLDYRSGSLGGARSTASTVFGPVENAVGTVVSPVGSWFASIGHLGSYKQQNQTLRRELAQARSQLHLTASDRAQLAELQKIYRLAGDAHYTVVGARVSAYGSSEGFEDTVTINRGSSSGIRVDQTVINGDGLVGRTVTVGRTSSTVLLASDPTFAAGARLGGPQQIGTVSGGGRGALTLTLFDTRTTVSAGQPLVTLGSSGNSPFVPEIPIGKVGHVNPTNGGTSVTASVVPYVNYTAVDLVAVVVKAPSVPKHDSLLPHPAPTVTVTTTVSPSPHPHPHPHPSGSSTPGATPTVSTTP